MAKRKTTADWWASLTVSQKERIATKVAKREVKYPECTEVWEELTDATKESIRKHCEGKHDYNMADWFDGKPYGD